MGNKNSHNGRSPEERMLAGVRPGEGCTVAAILGGATARRRLMDLGFVPGQDVVIIQNDGWGPVLASVDGSRVAVGRRLAEKLMVRCVKSTDRRVERPVHFRRRRYANNERTAG